MNKFMACDELFIASEVLRATYIENLGLTKL